MAIDIRYMAGLVDGDGCIRIASCKKGKKYYINGRIVIQMLDGDLLQEVHRTYGGFCKSYIRKNRIGKRPVWVWAVHAHKAFLLAERLVPYLHTKKRQAELLIELSKGKFKYRRITEEEGARRIALAEECKRLNARGI